MDGLCAGEITNAAHNILEHGHHTHSRDFISKHTKLLPTIIFIQYYSLLAMLPCSGGPPEVQWGTGAGIAIEYARTL